MGLALFTSTFHFQGGSDVHAHCTAGGRMADLHRLGRYLALLLIAALWAVSGPSWASIPATGTTSPWGFTGNVGGSGGSCGVQSFTGSTPTDVFQAVASRANGCQAPAGTTVVFLSCDSYNAASAVSVACRIQSTPAGQQPTTFTNNATRTLASCPSNSYLEASGSTCGCGLGFVQSGNTCVASGTQEALCGSLAGTSEWFSTAGKPALGATQCSNIGCQIAWGSTVSYTNKQTGITETEGNVTYTGTTCTFDPNQPQLSGSPDECKGGAWGSINGIQTCVPFDPNKNVVASTKSSDSTASGAATPASGGASSPTGTTSTTGTETTTCDAGKCTTTKSTTTTNADGSKTTTNTTESVAQEDYCTKNPKAPVCASTEAGTWAGSCSGAYSCKGDAALCAAAEGVWRQKCALVDGPSTPTAEQNAYAAALAASGAGITGTTTAISNANFDQSNALGVSGACIGDKVVTVMDKSVTLPFSNICPYVGYLGTLNLALSFLVAMFIVFRRTA